jgi:hypothetical protein
MPVSAKCSNNQQNSNTELELRRQVKRTLEILGFEAAGCWSTPRVQITPPTPIAEGMTANQLCITAETWSMGCVHSEPSDTRRVYYAARRPLVFCETVSCRVGIVAPNYALLG